MEKKPKQSQPQVPLQATEGGPPSLDHGVQSLVAKDNPDDVDLETAIRSQKRGSRR